MSFLEAHITPSEVSHIFASIGMCGCETNCPGACSKSALSSTSTISTSVGPSVTLVSIGSWGFASIAFAASRTRMRVLIAVVFPGLDLVLLIQVYLLGHLVTTGTAIADSECADYGLDCTQVDCCDQIDGGSWIDDGDRTRLSYCCCSSPCWTPFHCAFSWIDDND